MLAGPRKVSQADLRGASPQLAAATFHKDAVQYFSPASWQKHGKQTCKTLGRVSTTETVLIVFKTRKFHSGILKKNIFIEILLKY